MRLGHEEVYGIHKDFSETNFGKKLLGNVRYDKYRPSHVTEDEWVRLLGADVNNLTHMPLTYGLARAFIGKAREMQPDLLDDSEEKILLISALIHDWAESITSDISYGDKTAINDSDEVFAFEQNLTAFYEGEDFELVDKARREVVFNHDSKLGEIFNAIERVGYLRTALRASDILQNEVEDELLRQGFEWLVFDVMSNLQSLSDLDAEPALLKMRKFKPVAVYLAGMAPQIYTAFSLALSAQEVVLPLYGDNANKKHLQICCSFKNWVKYS